jgi:hypothetical protein
MSVPSMLETLIGGGIRRPDEKRILPTRRPLPIRSRDLLELFAAMGPESSFKTLMHAADFHEAEPRGLTFAALSRWPTAEELAAQETSYDPARHLRAMLLGEEFRKSLFRRVCDAYPERRRLLFVRIPGCAGTHFLHSVGPLHPIFPADLAHWPRNGAEFIAALGRYLGRFAATKTILFAASHQSIFTNAAQPAATPGLDWAINPPPYRNGDRLFTILREPASLILSLVNGTLTRLQQPPEADDQPLAAWRSRLAPLPAPDRHEDWAGLGRTLLKRLPTKNPICTALADGTAAGALNACRLSNIELAHLSRYTDWIKYSWATDAEPPINVFTPFLTPKTLGPQDMRHLNARIEEDVIFHDHVNTRLATLGEFQTFVSGREL